MAIIENLKNSVYPAIKIRNILVVNSSASGGFAPRPPPGLCLWTPLGDSVPQTPSDLLPPGQIPSYATGDHSSSVGLCAQNYSLYVQRLWFVPPWLTHRHTDRQTAFDPLYRIKWMKWKCNDLKCARKPTYSRLSLTHHANKFSPGAE